MSKYDDEGFIYTDTFEELFTELIIDRVYKTLKSKFDITKKCIKTIKPVGVYEGSNVMVIEVTFIDDFSTEQSKKIKFKATLVENEKNKLYNFIYNSCLAFDEK